MGESVARNKKAFHDYEILEKLEAGIVLQGSEVKAIRQGRVNLKDSFVKIIKGEAFLLNAHISHLSTANLNFAPNERAPRKLLLHVKQIRKWEMKVAKDGLTIVPLAIYFNAKNLAKVEIALARGKNEHDKRESLKEKDAQREAKTAMKNHLYKE
ncbi:SsrA-binding protein SmpB [Sulfurospirillum barnesii]|uniref:SsrA-binding protein n=1 Tax=Sulfurospirillum barnesii (strain ATCC 700032 / DSM 10660 / SES-3) TaxID=760154 RepID=I3XYG1_SULBS|nr:SsrA-binding protein SmpB [Sulfurospirillum barnesii]AFL68985.1 SsrA-binding protein [Sulfurospirillum barnesii SES-3]